MYRCNVVLFSSWVSCQNKDLDTQLYKKQIKNCGSKISSAVIHLKSYPRNYRKHRKYAFDITKKHN